MADIGNNNITENIPNNNNDNNTERICANDCDVGASTSSGAPTSVNAGCVRENSVEEVSNDDSSSDHDYNLDLSPGTSGGARDDDRCGICLAEKRSPVRVRCAHTFCRICLALHKSYKFPWSNRCPICRGTLVEKPAPYIKPDGIEGLVMDLSDESTQSTDDDYYYQDFDDENDSYDSDEADVIIFEGL